jgi:hypothetical protein
MPIKIKMSDLSALVTRLEKLKSPMDGKTAVMIGEEVTQEMQNLISKGISPIEGSGRFPGYKRQDDPKGYPLSVTNQFPDKKQRPVNLRLSGDFLNALDHKVKRDGSNYKTEIGYFDSEQAVKERGHREGANSQPKRPTLIKGDEKPAQRIQRIISRIFGNRIRQLLKK